MKPAHPTEFVPTLDVDFDALFAPLPDGDGGGVSLRYEPLYQQIRDAQREDDATLPMREWERPLIKADWKIVASLCSDALATRSKDFQIAGWLTEAWTRLYRIEGFIAGTWLLTALAERYWDTAWPRIDDGDAEARIAPFVWLNDTLARVLVLHVPLVTIENPEPAAVNLGDWQRVITGTANDNGNALTRELLAKQVTQGGNLAALVVLHQRLPGALDAWRSLTQFLDDRLGNDAPSLARVAEALSRLSQASTSLLGERALPQASLDDAKGDLPGATGGDTARPQQQLAAPIDETHGEAPATAAVLMPVIASRTHAYQLLETVAGYLAQQEPHSPTPYLLRRAVSWGRMPLAELMREIVREEGDLSRYLALLTLD